MIWREGSVVKNHLQLFQGTKFDPQHPPTSSSLQLPISPPPGALTTSSGFCRHWTDVWVHTQKPTYEHMESETLKKYQLNSFSQFCALKWFCKVKIKGRKKCRLGSSWARLLKRVVQSFFLFQVALVRLADKGFSALWVQAQDHAEPSSVPAIYKRWSEQALAEQMTLETSACITIVMWRFASDLERQRFFSWPNPSQVPWDLNLGPEIYRHSTNDFTHLLLPTLNDLSKHQLSF